jgi:ABC-type glutathione transport system ATPase component
MAASLLQLEELSVTYRFGDQGVRALEQVSLSVAPGEAVGILGESGCGKSTLARAILGLLPRSAAVDGSIHFRGAELLGLGETDLQHIRGAEVALIPQEPALALSPVLRAGEQVADVLRAHTSMSRRQCRSQAETLLTQVGLAEVPRIFDAFAHQLSGGQRQRVAIAQAIACHPMLLIADEPTTSLDTTTQAEILALLSELQRQHRMALIAITHDAAVLAELVDRVVVMRGGKVVEDGSVEQILTNPASDYARSLVEAVSVSAGVSR